MEIPVPEELQKETDEMSGNYPFSDILGHFLPKAMEHIMETLRQQDDFVDQITSMNVNLTTVWDHGAFLDKITVHIETDVEDQTGTMEYICRYGD